MRLSWETESWGLKHKAVNWVKREGFMFLEGAQHMQRPWGGKVETQCGWSSGGRESWRGESELKLGLGVS